LSFDTTRSELEKLFSEVSEVVEVFLPTDRTTGRPRGFAFVEFTDGSAVAEAIERFDGFELQGRRIRVNEAEERRPGPRFSDGGFSPARKPKGGKPKGSRRNLRGRKRGF
jgi:RNA recognition motif-containing protein